MSGSRPGRSPLPHPRPLRQGEHGTAPSPSEGQRQSVDLTTHEVRLVSHFVTARATSVDDDVVPEVEERQLVRILGLRAELDGQHLGGTGSRTTYNMHLYAKTGACVVLVLDGYGAVRLGRRA